MVDTPTPAMGNAPNGSRGIDPTPNVLNLVDAAVLRLDDLRIAAERLSNVKHGFLEKIVTLNAKHAGELRLAEANRLDAIRDVDVAAAALREERAVAQAAQLAGQLTATAETMRTTVATTAAAAEAAAAAVTGPLSDRITALERTGYIGTGKSEISDPAMGKLVEAVEGLKKTVSEGTGRHGLSQPLMLALAGGGGALILYLLENMMRGSGVQ